MQRFLTSASVAALAMAGAAPALAQPVTINGGGASSQQFVYAAPDVNGKHVAEQPLFDSLQKNAQFGTYWSVTSGAAQSGLLTNDLTCLINKFTGQNNGQCSGTPGGAYTVHYAISETVLTPTQTAQWSTSSWGQSAAGNLIQIPAMGTGLAIVVNDTNITANGQLTLTDSDLCEIFSGGYTDFSQITDSKTVPAAGAFFVVYRSDSAGTTYSLTNHLSAVCTSANTAPGVTFTPTSSFSTLFKNIPINQQIPGAFPVNTLPAMANTLAGLSSYGPMPQAFGYISPDWTSVDSATSSAKLSNGEPSPLLVAGLVNGKKAYIPDIPSIKAGLQHPLKAVNLTPPSTAAQGANPLNWVPVIQTTSAGYPIVTYSTIDIPQCYASAQMTAGMLQFLTDHYDHAQFKTIQANNGLVAVAKSKAADFLRPIRQNILANKNGWNTNLGNPAACAGLAGR